MSRGFVQAKAVVPKSLAMNQKAYQRAIDNALDGRAEDIRIDFLVTTQTWSRKPDFVVVRTKQGRRIYTSNLIYKYVSAGTKPHIIKARRAPTLRFFGKGFKAKSRARWIGSNVGRKADKNFRTPFLVHHPGNEAREYDVVIAEKWRRLWPILMQRAINYEIKRQGGG